MEKICKIVAIGNVESREGTLRNGEKKMFKSISVRLADGADEFVAEAMDDLCEKLEHNPLPIGTNVSVQANLRVQEWKTKDGEQRFSNFINLKNMRVM